MTRFLKFFTILSCFVALAAPSAAFAASASETGYGDESANILPATQDDGDGDDVAGTTVSTDDGGSLPFTGAELGVLAGAGALLVLLGFGLRRLSHRPERA